MIIYIIKKFCCFRRNINDIDNYENIIDTNKNNLKIRVLLKNKKIQKIRFIRNKDFYLFQKVFNDDFCIICYNNFCLDSDISYCCNCKQIFHKECFDKWGGCALCYKYDQRK